LKRLLILVVLALLLAIASLLIPDVRQSVRALLRPEPPPRITPLALVAPPTRAASPRPTATAQPTTVPTRTTLVASTTPTITPTPEPSPTPTQVVIDGRVYDAYIPAATKESQAYQYSCEFDAAWVILQTYGYDVSVDALIEAVGVDDSIEPYIEQTGEGYIIHGGDIATAFSGDYKENFLARSTGEAMRKAFERYDLLAAPVHDRAAVEAALRSGALIWMKTTVDFKPWRPATWQMPDGSTRRTVLGNDHAVVVIGFNAESVVIRDVLGPTSSNRQRPYEYEVDWPTFLAAWEAQEFDGLAVSPP
jgi:hypothetical protein